MAALLAVPAAAGPINWAHQNGALQSNGALTVNTLGGAAYTAGMNPTGAFAKANQNAATQPPTVIIQATGGGGYSETIPLINPGSVIPSCPAGYTRVYETIGNDSSVRVYSYLVVNAGGTRWSLFGYYDSAGAKTVGWIMDQQLTYSVNGNGSNPATARGPWQYADSRISSDWAAAICTR